MAEKATPPPQAPVAKKRKQKLPIRKIISAALIAALIIFGAFYFVQYTKISAKYKDVTTTAEEKNKLTAAKVAKLIDLPKEAPTEVTAVKNKEKLANTQSVKTFFEKVNNDDIILAYKKANVAVVYRPSENKVIKSDTYANYFAAAYPTAVAIIAPADQQAALTQQLESKYGNILIVKKDTPKVLTGQSYVVDLSGTNAKTAADLAAQLGLTVGTLPEGEPKPEGAVFAVVVSPAAQ